MLASSSLYGSPTAVAIKTPSTSPVQVPSSAKPSFPPYLTPSASVKHRRTRRFTKNIPRDHQLDLVTNMICSSGYSSSVKTSKRSISPMPVICAKPLFTHNSSFISSRLPTSDVWPFWQVRVSYTPLHNLVPSVTCKSILSLAGSILTLRAILRHGSMPSPSSRSQASSSLAARKVSTAYSGILTSSIPVATLS